MADENSIEESFNEIKKNASFSLNDIVKSMDEMIGGANELNKVFGQSNQRMAELMNTVADATPGILKLGGSMADVNRTIQSISEATGKNIAASAEDVSKLYATSQVVGSSVDTLVNKFADIGVQFPQIGKQLEGSVNYIQNLGLNVKGVMETVTRNMEQMNRFQFEGGVQGLTKMAAQASMLRFDMNETFRLADKVLTPEGAIQTASAFQRLGVAAGDLVDPFQLMNQSINDPSGLQTSLANVAKQFTYFDEKTQSFKINPQGVLTLKAMAEETGVSAAEMSKLGLSAAELDKKMSNIRPDIKFENEDDKKLLANIATMDSSSGEYKVSISDREGHVEQVRLSDLTQEQTKLLVEQQKNAPKDMEGIARSQLTLTEQINADISAIKSKITMGVASTDQFKTVTIAAKEISSNLLGSIEKAVPKSSSVRGEMTKLVDNVGQLMESFSKSGDKKGTLDALDKFKTQFSGYGTKIDEMVTKAITEMKSNVNNTKVNLTDKINETIGLKDAKSKYDADLKKHQVEVAGKVNVDFTSSTNAFAGLSKSQFEELLKKPEFQEAITKMVHQKWPQMYSGKQ
jgi:hypothetical protein